MVTVHPAVRITFGLVGLILLGVGVGLIATSWKATGTRLANRVSALLGGVGQVAVGLGLVIAALTTASLPGLVGVIVWAATAFIRFPLLLLSRRVTARSERESSEGSDG